MCVMGIWAKLTDALGLSITDETLTMTAYSAGPRFAVDIPVGWGSQSAATQLAPLVTRIKRDLALTVPAVRRGRNLICNPIAGLPLRTYNATHADVTPELLVQPEIDRGRSITMAETIEDLVFDAVAWWRITETYGPEPYDYPKRVKRLCPVDVDTSIPGQVWWTDPDTGKRERLTDRELIRFRSPNGPVLVNGAGAIATIIMLDRRAYRSAENPTPDGYFTPKDGADPFLDDDDPSLTEDERALLDTARNFLRRWHASRMEGTQGYVPSGLAYEQLQWDPKAMQLAEARQHAVLDIAREFDLEPEDLAVSTTSRTYFNAETKRRDRIDFALAPYMRAIEDRLSMGDVTPRGQYVRFFTDAFTNTDTGARYANYRAARELRLQTVNEQRALENQPPIEGGDTFELEPAATAARPTPEDSTVNNVRHLPAAAARPAAHQFADSDVLAMSAPIDTTFKVDAVKRQIAGLVIPYGDARAFSRGSWYAFTQGSVVIPADVSRVKMYVNHDESHAIGHAVSLDDRAEGLYGVFQLDRSDEASRALEKAEDKVWDGLSAGIRQGGKFHARDGAQFAVSAPLGEVSLCPSPAFDDSRVSAVALSADTGKDHDMQCTTCGQIHAAGVTACDPAAVATFTAQTTTPTPAAAPAAGDPVQLSDITRAITDGFGNLQQQLVAALPAPQRETVPAAGAQFQVNEELPYRFDGSTAGEHCFTDDLRDSWTGNQEAKGRLDKFLEEWGNSFAVSTSNVSAFNPTQNRPNMYVAPLVYSRPIWDAASTGTIDNITPFTIPKFGASSGLVGPHVQGTEPTPGAFSATVQTVTPTAISGKVEINREVWDQGGNPQTDTIVWGEMQNAYLEGAETRLATVLNAIPAANLYGGAEVNFGGAVDGALDDEFTELLTALQFARGGNRYTSAVADGQLYGAITGAKDTAGRSLYPLLGPTNADGTVQPMLAAANVKGQTVRPAWALGSTVASHSYFFVPSSVWAWLSAPKRLQFEYQVKSIDMAVWGYTAAAVLRDTDVIRVDYTTADV